TYNTYSPGIAPTIQTLPPVQRTVLVPVTICTPDAGRTGANFKIGDNESPIPTDRVFFTYNYFNNLQGMKGFTPVGVQTASSTTTGFLSSTVTNTATVTPPVYAQPNRVDVQSETFGFEKTFLSGDASFELRVPIFQSTDSQDAFNGDHWGDMTGIVKFALIN